MTNLKNVVVDFSKTSAYAVLSDIVGVCGLESVLSALSEITDVEGITATGLTLDLKYNELLRQEYSGNNCIFSAGFVEGHPVDTMYLRLEKNGKEPTIILLRPDEMAIIVWLANGVLWSGEIAKINL